MMILFGSSYDTSDGSGAGHNGHRDESHSNDRRSSSSRRFDHAQRAMIRTYLSVNGAPAARTPGQNRTAGRSIHRLGAGTSVHRSPAGRGAFLPRSWATGP